MDKINLHDTTFQTFHHVGLAVRDVNKAVEYFQSLGIGPFVAREQEFTISEGSYRGKANTSIPIIRWGRIGSIALELLQPREGESLVREFLEKRGEGIYHLGFLVTDVENESEKLENKGFKVICTRKFKGGGGCAFFETGEAGGLLIEIMQLPRGETR
jgi:catechol 2,3-dioxygenase-like lactoylglutathione lyase family enzyme